MATAPAVSENLPASRSLRPPRWWAVLLFGLYAAVQLIYITATPLQPIILPDNVPPAQAETPLLVGLGPDEKEHFLYIASLSERGELPAQAPRRRKSPEQYVSYEVQHPPLFYALCVPFYKIVKPLGLPTLWWTLRGFCALLGAVAALLAARAAQTAFPNRAFVQWGALPLALFWPTFAHTMANLSNEPLASVIGAAIWLTLVQAVTRPQQTEPVPSTSSSFAPLLRTALTLGVLFGLGSITRLTTLIWLPGAVLTLAYLTFRDKAQNQRPLFVRPLLVAVCLFAPLLLFWSPWLAYTYREFGTFNYRSHLRPLLQDITLAEYLQNPTQRIFPKKVERGIVMPPSYLLLWGVSTAWLPYWLAGFYLPGGPAFGPVLQAFMVLSTLR